MGMATSPSDAAARGGAGSDIGRRGNRRTDPHVGAGLTPLPAGLGLDFLFPTTPANEEAGTRLDTLVIVPQHL